MNRGEAIEFARKAVGYTSRPAPPPRRELPAVQPLPSEQVVRDEAEWERRERWITENGGMPLPAVQEEQ